jgi:hypothetical protein
VSIAYQVAGAGPFDLVYVPSMTHHVEMDWKNPHVSLFLERLASLSRLLVFDKRGTGMSDRQARRCSLSMSEVVYPWRWEWWVGTTR